MRKVGAPGCPCCAGGGCPGIPEYVSGAATGSLVDVQSVEFTLSGFPTSIDLWGIRAGFSGSFLGSDRLTIANGTDPIEQVSVGSFAQINGTYTATLSETFRDPSEFFPPCHYEGDGRAYNADGVADLLLLNSAGARLYLGDFGGYRLTHPFDVMVTATQYPADLLSCPISPEFGTSQPFRCRLYVILDLGRAWQNAPNTARQWQRFHTVHLLLARAKYNYRARPDGTLGGEVSTYDLAYALPAIKPSSLNSGGTSLIELTDRGPEQLATRRTWNLTDPPTDLCAGWADGPTYGTGSQAVSTLG